MASVAFLIPTRRDRRGKASGRSLSAPHRSDHAGRCLLWKLFFKADFDVYRRFQMGKHQGLAGKSYR
jgi:hypothetical protein